MYWPRKKRLWYGWPIWPVWSFIPGRPELPTLIVLTTQSSTWILLKSKIMTSVKYARWRWIYAGTSKDWAIILS